MRQASIDLSPAADVVAVHGALDFATRLRQAAQQNLVRSFSAHIHAGGPAPADDDLRLFAKRVADEHRWARHYARCLISSATQDAQQSGGPVRPEVARS